MRTLEAMPAVPARWASRFLRVARTLWFVPLVMAVCGVALGLLLPLADRLAAVRGWLGAHRAWTALLLSATPDGARQLLGTSAGSLATILGVAFSLTLVALQLAAQQYTPRLVGRLMDDRLTKVVLGSYLGTIAYLLLVLRLVHGSVQDLERFVPWLSIALGIVLFLWCLALLAAFLNRLATSIQATNVVARVAREAIRRVRAGEARTPEGACPPPPGGAPVWLEAREHGHVQVIDVDEIARVAPRGATFLHVRVSAGDFVFAGQRIAAVWPARPLEGEEIERLQEAFVTGAARTPDQDLMLSVQQLSDVALKALSPSLNDETTAVLAVNELGAIGIELARADVPAEGWRRSERDGVVVVAPVVGMRRFVEEAFHGVIRASGGHPRVLARLADVLAALAAATRRDDARAEARRAAGWIAEALGRLDREGREDVERRLVSGTGVHPARDDAPAVH